MIGKPVYEKSSLSTKLKSMGPALIIVGSFIGPGSITSSTKAGANYGFSLIWCVTFSIIAVVVLQGMASRLGIVTHKRICENLVVCIGTTAYTAGQTPKLAGTLQ